MVVVRLRSPLRDLAGGKPEVEVDGGTVGEVLRALELEHPRITGWILDEQGRVRRHVNVFVDGERTGEETALGAEDVVQVLPSIAGGGHR